MPDEDEVSIAKRFQRHFSKERFGNYFRPGRWFDAEGTTYPDEREPDRSQQPGPLGPPEGYDYIDPQSGEHVVRPPPRPETGGTFRSTAPKTYVDMASGSRLPVKEDDVFFDDMGRPFDSYYIPDADDYVLVPHRPEEKPREGEYIDPQGGDHVVPHGYRPARDVNYDPPSEAQKVEGGAPMPQAKPPGATPMPVYIPNGPIDTPKNYQTSREPAPAPGRRWYEREV